jgi:FkbM family methyltransferase
MKRIINYLLGYFDLKISKRSKPLLKSNYYSHLLALSRALPHIQKPSTVIDIGAAKGEWTLETLSLLPDADYLLFEPLKEREEELSQLAAKYNNIHFIPYAAGAKNEEIKFRISEDLDGSGVGDVHETQNVRVLKVTSVQEEIIRHQSKPPYLIKLDTHGYEVPILEGCEQLLTQTSMFIIECYGFHLTGKSLLFHELCQYMYQKGFRLYDIIDVLRRPTDNAFWQCDAFFIPVHSDLFKNNTYRN